MARFLITFTQVAADQLNIKAVNTSGNGGVGGEDVGGADLSQRGVVIQALVHAFADTLQAQEASVSLIQVGNARTCQATGIAESVDGAHAADTQHQLLLDAVFRVAAVQTVGHIPQVNGVFFNVGIQKQQRHAANLSHPQRNHNVTVVREGNGDGDLLAVFIQDWRHGKIARIVVLVVFFLPAIAGQRLREIAVGVQKTHTDQRNTEVRGGFHVITREHAQTARVNRQGGVNAKLH